MWLLDNAPKSFSCPSTYITSLESSKISPLVSQIVCSMSSVPLLLNTLHLAFLVDLKNRLTNCCPDISGLLPMLFSTFRTSEKIIHCWKLKFRYPDTSYECHADFQLPSRSILLTKELSERYVYVNKASRVTWGHRFFKSMFSEAVEPRVGCLTNLSNSWHCEPWRSLVIIELDTSRGFKYGSLCCRLHTSIYGYFFLHNLYSALRGE